MGYTLHAVFLKIDSEYQFYKYFWDGMDAFHIAETSSQLIDERVTGYKLEEHLVPKEFNFKDPTSYLKIAPKYELKYQTV